ncbi:MAG: response regulator transcription factor [Gudongella sp.]|nr:response regulator transcription factor [Gudongella sp.]
MENILVVDDEKEIVELIELYLVKENYKIIKAYDGEEALYKVRESEISLAIVDIMMPKLNGFQVIKEIRKEYNIPVIILSARDDFSDKILGLDIGADDYMTKPFNPLELLARIQAQLRRFNELNKKNHAGIEDEAKTVGLGKLTLDPVSCTLSKNGEVLALTSTEYRIFEYLVMNAGRVFTKKQIFEHVWNEAYYDDENAIRVHISNLRDKVEDDPRNPEFLKTVRGLGYKIERR